MRKWDIAAIVVIAIALCMLAWSLVKPAGKPRQVPDMSAFGSVSDTVGHPSFVPQAQFWGDVQEDGLQVGMGFPSNDLRYRLGKPIRLTLSIRNSGARPQAVFPLSPDTDFRVTVTGLLGTPAPMTDLGRRWEQQWERGGPSNVGGPVQRFILTRGEECTETLMLDDLYDIRVPGIYTVTAVYTLYQYNPVGYDKPMRHQVGPITIFVGSTWQIAIVGALLAMCVLGVLAVGLRYIRRRAAGASRTVEK